MPIKTKKNKMPTGVYKRIPGNLIEKVKHQPWMLTGKHMKGRKLSKETIKKIIETKTINGTLKHEGQFKKGFIPWNKGIKITNNSGRTHFPKGHVPANKGKSSWSKGKHFSKEHRAKLGGENSHLWRGGITPKNTKIRNSLETRMARVKCFERDDYTCQSCKIRGGKLQVHHIKPFSKYSELRFILENLITLCIDCHKKTDTYLKIK